jgi:hypothetical protein
MNLQERVYQAYVKLGDSFRPAQYSYYSIDKASGQAYCCGMGALGIAEKRVLEDATVDAEDVHAGNGFIDLEYAIENRVQDYTLERMVEEFSVDFVRGFERGFDNHHDIETLADYIAEWGDNNLNWNEFQEGHKQGLATFEYLVQKGLFN